MKFQFVHQPVQAEAATAISDVSCGKPMRTTRLQQCYPCNGDQYAGIPSGSRTRAGYLPQKAHHWRNPFDWMMGYFAMSSNPLGTLRDLIQEYYLSDPTVLDQIEE